MDDVLFIMHNCIPGMSRKKETIFILIDKWNIYYRIF